jgi:hypothetical protein
MTASHCSPLDRPSMPDIYSKPIKGIGVCHVPLIMEDKELLRLQVIFITDYGKNFIGKSKAKVNH